MRARPGWDDYFLGLARVVARRSPDENTQHGCVVVSPGRHVLATGYNGFPRGLRDDGSLPASRPGPGEEPAPRDSKYAWMIHAEANAVVTAPCPLAGATAYVTGRSCVHCLMLLHQAGVARVVEVAGHGWAKDAGEAPLRAEFLARSGLAVESVAPDLAWLRGAVPGA